MKESSEKVLSDIASEYPEQLAVIHEHPEIQPPVKEEYLYELCKDNESLTELLEEMLEYFYRYTYDVCEQESLIKKGLDENLAEIQERDVARSALHNAMIDSVKILVRNLQNAGKDTSWHNSIDKGGRAGYASLALLTTFLDIIRSEK